MKKHANLFCVGAALSLLCACESVVKAPRTYSSDTRSQASGMAKDGNIRFCAFRSEYF